MDGYGPFWAIVGLLSPVRQSVLSFEAGVIKAVQHAAFEGCFVLTCYPNCLQFLRRHSSFRTYLASSNAST